MNKISFMLLAFVLLILNGCAGNKLIEYSDSHDCKTTIEGNFFSPSIYKFGGGPAVLFPRSELTLIRHGKVIKKDSSGIVFVQDKSGF